MGSSIQWFHPLYPSVKIKYVCVSVREWVAQGSSKWDASKWNPQLYYRTIYTQKFVAVKCKERDARDAICYPLRGDAVYVSKTFRVECVAPRRKLIKPNMCCRYIERRRATGRNLRDAARAMELFQQVIVFDGGIQNVAGGGDKRLYISYT